MEGTTTLADLVLAGAAVAFLLFSAARERFRSDPDPVDQLREQYTAGEIDAAEFERRLAFHLDDRNERIRATVETVNGVGPATSRAIAERFDSVDELRATSRADLESVPGVGEQTASAVLDTVAGESTRDSNPQQSTAMTHDSSDTARHRRAEAVSTEGSADE